MEDTKQLLSHWFVKNYGLVLGLAFSRAPSPDMATDIAQTAYLEFLEEPAGSMDNEALLPVLRRVVCRVAQRHWDEKQRKTPEKLEKVARFFQQLASDKEEECRFDDEIVALRECMSKLSEKKRFLIEQHYFMKQTSQSIGAHFGISGDAVAHAIFRIRQKLGSCIRLSMQRRGKHA